MPGRECVQEDHPKEPVSAKPCAQPAEKVKPGKTLRHREYPVDAALCPAAKKRRPYPVDAAVFFKSSTGDAAASSRSAVINPEEDRADIRRKGPLIDAAVGEVKARDEDLPASDRELVIEGTMGNDDMSDVSDAAELTNEQELLRAAGLDVSE